MRGFFWAGIEGEPPSQFLSPLIKNFQEKEVLELHSFPWQAPC